MKWKLFNVPLHTVIGLNARTFKYFNQHKRYKNINVDRTTSMLLQYLLKVCQHPGVILLLPQDAGILSRHIVEICEVKYVFILFKFASKCLFARSEATTNGLFSV